MPRTSQIQKMIETLGASPTAITFVDVISILRAIRTFGLEVGHFSPNLLKLLEHRSLTTGAQRHLTQALQAEAKTQHREFTRAREIITLASHGKKARAHCGQTLRVELKTRDGAFWEFMPDPQGLHVQALLGEGARAGFEVFQLVAQKPGVFLARWTQNQDMRKRTHAPQQNNEPFEFYFEITVTPQP